MDVFDREEEEMRYYALQCLYCGIVTSLPSKTCDGALCPECGKAMVIVGKYIPSTHANFKKLLKKKGCPANNNACIYLDRKCKHDNPRISDVTGRIACGSYNPDMFKALVK